MLLKTRTIFLFVAVLLFSATATTVQIEAENFTSSDKEISLTELDGGIKTAGPTAGSGWLAFDVYVPEAGRYQCQIKISSVNEKPVSVWLEDYYDNTDDRTYNITGAVTVAPTGDKSKFISVTRDGSPLNTGMHKMKLHYTGDGIYFDHFKFSLMTKHQLTPQVKVQNMTGTDWKLVWSDEFNGEGLPDLYKWTYDVGNWGWGNNEPQYYTESRTENARQENGYLIIEARKKDMGQEWTSARLTTRGKISFIYGKIEFRAKVPVREGTWAAGWLLGDSYRDEISWPYCGEIDVLECVGREIDDETGDGLNHASCHTRGFYFKQGNHISNIIPVQNMKDEFHTYSIEWYPDGIYAFIDGKKYYTYDKLKGLLEWPFNTPQNLIINLAMGGGMGGNIDSEIESQQFILDYVRVYKLQ